MTSPIWMQYTWRDTGRQVKVGPLDGRLMVFFVLWIMFPSFLLFSIALLSVVFFYILDYMGYTLPNAIRKVSVALAGKKRNGVHYWRQSKFRY